MDQHLIEIVQDLIRLESEAPPGREAGTGEYIYDFLKEAGLKPHRQYCTPDRFNVTAELGRGDEGSLSFLYCGHMDVVPAGETSAWTTPPYEPNIREGRLYGRGACDMKGSLACALYAAKQLASRPDQFSGRLQLFFDVDEEHRNIGLWRFLKDNPSADFVIVGEPTDMEIALGHRGVMAFEITFTGKSAHAARPGEGNNAIYAAGSFIARIQKLQEEMDAAWKSGSTDIRLPSSAVQVTVIKGGTKVNMIPQECTAELDCRLGMGETQESMEEKIRQILEQVSEESGCGYSFRRLTSCPAGWCSPDGSEIAAIEEILMEYRGRQPVPGVFGASCEAGLLQKNLNAPAVILGPGSLRQAHVTDEYITLNQLEEGAYLYTRIFEKLMNAKVQKRSE
ncbi:M20 family metallopeptidase [Murimonas intestini]|uniref:M20 family metallopeptidase n=1 Tax=Murimonas intestini TaxID=1337051 RepID=UPI00248C5C1D|nr:M20 family metallopeptidase [Murimonas intestini]